MHRYPNSFSNQLPNIVGWTLQEGTRELREVTLDEWYRRHYMDMSLFLLGANGAGKTQLTMAMAKDFAIRKRRQFIGVSKSFDPFGCVTKSGRMAELGALVFCDAALKTLMNDVIEREAMKHLVHVRKSAPYQLPIMKQFFLRDSLDYLVRIAGCFLMEPLIMEVFC